MTTESSDLRRRVTRLERSSASIRRLIARMVGLVLPRKRNTLSRALTPVQKHDFRREMRAHGVRKDSDYTPDPNTERRTTGGVGGVV